MMVSIEQQKKGLVQDFGCGARSTTFLSREVLNGNHRLSHGLSSFWEDVVLFGWYSGSK